MADDSLGENASPVAGESFGVALLPNWTEEQRAEQLSLLMQLRPLSEWLNEARMRGGSPHAQPFVQHPDTPMAQGPPLSGLGDSLRAGYEEEGRGTRVDATPTHHPHSQNGPDYSNNHQ